jgi:putative transcriptional regulator
MRKVLRWRLKALMAQRKMSNKQLAETLGVHRNTVHQLKDDAPTMIRLKHLEDLCRVLQCTPSYLFELQPEVPLANAPLGVTGNT